MQQSRQIFDRHLATSRRAAALTAPDYPDFLDKLIAEELAMRLEMIERRFETCVILGQPAPVFVEQLATAKSFGKLVTAFSATANEPDLACDLECLPFADNSVDCIIAPPGLELVNDLPGVFIQINRALKPDGLFLGAMFAGETLNELRQAWFLADDAHCGGASPRVAPFVDIRQAGNLLQRAGLALPVSDTERVTVRYDNALDLMREIKKMGLANPLADRSRKPSSRGLLHLVNKKYAEMFSDDDQRIRATVEINYLTAWSPHESQQKPLKPGSASHRLSELLDPKKSPE